MLRARACGSVGDGGPGGPGWVVVGQEGGSLLCAGPEGEGGWAVWSQDLAGERAPVRLHGQAGPGRVVGASADAGSALLAVTTEEQRRREGGEEQAYFRTALVEILPAGKSYSLNVRSLHVQRVQFVGGTAAGASSRLFLFMVEGKSVRLYQMHSRRRAGGGVQITAQPVFLTELAKEYQWYQWEGVSERLYVLANSSLRCFAFGKKEKLVWEIPLHDPIVDSLPRSHLDCRHYPRDGRPLLYAAQRIQLVSLGDGGLCLCLQGPPVTSGKRVALPVVLFVLHHAVRLALDLPLALQSSCIPLVSCLALGRHMLLVWAPGHAAALFDLGIGHAPSASLCAVGALRVPPLPCLAGPDDDCFLAPLPWTGAAPSSSSSSSSFGEGHLQGLVTLLHSRTGTLLSVEVDRALLLELVSAPGPRLHLQAMHVAVVHLRDAELFRQLAMHALLQAQGVAASRELLAEYLVATAHLRLAQEGRLPAHVLAVLPLTTLPSVFEPPSPTLAAPAILAAASIMLGFVAVVSAKGELTLEPDTAVNNTAQLGTGGGIAGGIAGGSGGMVGGVSGVSGGVNGGGNGSGPIGGLRSSPARLPVGSPLSSSSSHLSPLAMHSPNPGSPMLADLSPSSSFSSSSAASSSSSSSGMSRLVQLLFGRDDSDSHLFAGPQEGEGPDGAEAVSVCESWGPRFEENFAELLYKELREKEPRGKCLRHAKLIRRAQVAQVGQLFKCISDAAQQSSAGDGATFRILENFFCVLEQLSLPLPSGFAVLFCSLGFRVLSQRLFLQYVERNVFFLTDAFIVSVLPLCASPELRFLLVSRMRDLDLLVRTLWQDPDNSRHVVPHLVAQTGIALPEASHDVDVLESADDAFFVPLAVFREHVRLRGAGGTGGAPPDEAIEFVYRAVTAEIRGKFW